MDLYVMMNESTTGTNFAGTLDVQRTAVVTKHASSIIRMNLQSLFVLHE
jgi:hypothetical protein